MEKTDIIPLLVGLALGTCLTTILIKRGFYRTHPFFAVYVLSSVFGQILKLAVFRDYPLYFKVYWGTEAVYAILALLALHEVFRRVFRGFYLVYRWFRLLFPGVVGLTLAVTVWHALSDPPIQASPITAAILLFAHGVSLMQVGAFCLLVLLADSLKLRWRYSALGVVLGFALLGVGAAGAYWLRSKFGTKFGPVAKYAPPMAYMIANIVWLATFLRSEDESKWPSDMTPEQLTDEIERDTMVLKRFKGKLK